jgi:hypothetical protein
MDHETTALFNFTDAMKARHVKGTILHGPTTHMTPFYWRRKFLASNYFWEKYI